MASHRFRMRRLALASALAGVVAAVPAGAADEAPRETPTAEATARSADSPPTPEATPRSADSPPTAEATARSADSPPAPEATARQPVSLAVAKPASAGSITLDSVLESVELHYPLLLAVRAERDVREAGLRSNRGAFDTRIAAEGGGQPEGFYRNQGGAVKLEQDTRLWGARFDVGYRYGGGEYPSYQGDRLTDGSGEVKGGVTVPLLRGGAVDESRTKIRKSELELASATPEIEMERIRMRRDASEAYWRWVAAGRGLEVTEALLQVAVDRQDQIAGRVKKGAEPEIDLVDNERLIVDRRMRLRAAERDFEQAGIDLSLFFRDARGEPLRPASDALPRDFPAETTIADERISADLEQARLQHPLVRKLELERDKWVVEQRLARNDMLPEVDLRVTASQDFGERAPGIDTTGKLSAAPRGETEVGAMVRFAMPVQRREAAGRRAVGRLREAQVEQRLRFARERIVAELERAVEGLEAAYEQTTYARRNLELALELQRAEERKLSLGLSNLIDVNIRELQAASAAQSLIDAQASYFVALADYDAAAARPRVDG